MLDKVIAVTENIRKTLPSQRIESKLSEHKCDGETKDLTDDDLRGLYDIFCKADKDKNGCIDRFEIVTLMKEMGLEPKDEEIIEIMRGFDEDDDFSINFREWV